MARVYKDKNGYPRYTNLGMPVHTAVSQNMIGGRVGEGRVTHHKDGNKMNFRRTNLEVMDRDEHSRLHARKRRSSWW